ncbi:Na+/H+ antiporter NhaA [Rhizohabitans arisaemae]|uniref:Na+/H+ antiporter NhaA n=1 Tax=Rhizohabitans arisaemae TaxID=2720610 RepID=UPI0024B161C1|nr:Na+/H+ antiporter NhaA [Rhizohabitans arisaemae]
MRRAAAIWPIRPTVRYARQLAEELRAETIGGVIMLAATAIALIWANSPWAASYTELRQVTVGPSALHLDLTLLAWASDGLLAIFFFVAGLEVKEEFVNGELSNLRDAILPIVAAVAGMVVPALLYVAVSWNVPGAEPGWAIPMATDIAFALAVLAVTASALPVALRAFLLTLAVVDDLGAIAVIAIFYTKSLSFLPLLAAALILALFGYLQHKRVKSVFIYIVLGVAAWVLIHQSGVHATVAGVMCGLLTRTKTDPGEEFSPCERWDHAVRPISAGFAVPVFAFFAAGVSLSGDSLKDVFTDRVALAVVVGLVIGKFLGVFTGAWLSVKLGFAKLSDELNWHDIAAVSVLAGIGFTVSLLIGEKAFGGTPQAELVTTAVLAGSLIASVFAAALLRIRVRKRIGEQNGG